MCCAAHQSIEQIGRVTYCRFYSLSGFVMSGMKSMLECSRNTAKTIQMNIAFGFQRDAIGLIFAPQLRMLAVHLSMPCRKLNE